ncbi:MAG: ComF family protein [Rhodospirillales bacterium]|nr:ComF family protein [Rhodospirillales bacterium]
MQPTFSWGTSTEAGFSAIARLGRAALDAVLPPRCLTCGTIVGTAHALCSECWPTVRFIHEPLCARCGIPFEFDAGPGCVCAVCAATDRPHHRVRAAVAYDDGSRPLILRFKNGDRTDAVRVFAPWMLRAGRQLLTQADIIAPVPLHWTRLFSRKYNQAALLAQAIGRLSLTPVRPDLLVRRKRTHKLGKSGPAERAKTVRGAFAVPARHKREIDGFRILLIDDVYTTGSTAAACARALLAAGAQAVDVLALARVIRPSGIPVPPTGSKPGTARADEEDDLAFR